MLSFEPHPIFARLFLCWAIAILAPFSAVSAHATDTDEPTPSPIAAPLLEAALGENDGEPTSAELRDKRIQQLASALRDTADDYGPDSVVMQVKLMVHSMSAGALGPTEVRIAGPSDGTGQYLRIEVATGIFFDADATSERSRAATAWEKIVAPTLGSMETFNFEPEGVELAVTYSVQRPVELLGGKLDPMEPAIDEFAEFRFTGRRLSDLLVGVVTIEDLAPN